MNFVEVVVDSIRVSLMSPQRIIILRELDSDRFLPIWIGPFEADAITLSLQELEVARPLTHDLLRNVLQTLDASVVRVNITELKDDVFYARIVLSVDGRELEIDSRPSDALALAVRVNVPIFVSEEVMEEASSVPEADVEVGEEMEDGEDRLEVFKDFVENLDLDDLDSKDEESKE
jgi:bifunctional DNase/RNase